MFLSEFYAPFWLSNCQAQTLAPYYLRPVPSLELKRHRLALPDGDFVDLDCTANALNEITPIHAESAPPVVILLHGLEGSTESKYMQTMLKELDELGWHGIGVNSRGCSGEPNRLPCTYHSGETATAQAVIDFAKQRHPNSPLFVVGVSLGGSMLLNTLADCSQAKQVTAACAVSVPYDLATGADRMNRGFSKVYRNHFIDALKDKIRSKKAIIDASDIRIDWQRMEASQDFWEYDDCVTAPLNGFADVHDYYQRSSSKFKLKRITRPTLLIHAKDDPFMTPNCAPSAQDVLDNITLLVSERGGHVGFVQGSLTKGLDFDWVNRQALVFFHGYVET